MMQGRTVTDASTRACIILAPPDLPDRADALAVRDDLIERGFMPRLCHDPYHACVELCLLEKGQSTRQHWGLKRHTSPALVFLRHDADDHWNAEIDALIAVLQRDLPGCLIAQSIQGELRELTQPQPDAPEEEPVPPASESTPDAPSPKTNGHLGATDAEPSPISHPPVETDTTPIQSEPGAHQNDESNSAPDSADDDAADELPSDRLSRAEIDMLLGADAFDDDAEAPPP
jgi:hypothetical protein